MAYSRIRAVNQTEADREARKFMDDWKYCFFEKHGRHPTLRECAGLAERAMKKFPYKYEDE